MRKIIAIQEFRKINADRKLRQILEACSKEAHTRPTITIIAEVKKIGDRPRFIWYNNLNFTKGGIPMPRRARLILPEVPLHLIQRGNNERLVFLNRKTTESFRLFWTKVTEDQLAKCMPGF